MNEFSSKSWLNTSIFFSHIYFSQTIFRSLRVKQIRENTPMNSHTICTLHILFYFLSLTVLVVNHSSLFFPPIWRKFLIYICNDKKLISMYHCLTNSVTWYYVILIKIQMFFYVCYVIQHYNMNAIHTWHFEQPCKQMISTL